MSQRSQRLVVLASGSGSNLQALLDACADDRIADDRIAHNRIEGQIVAVVSNNADAYALQRSSDAGVPAVHVGRKPDEARADYDARLARHVAAFDPDLIILAGWMRILTMSFLRSFPRIVVNLHPARPGELAGTGAIERAWEDALAGTRTSTGVMVHLVPDEGVDDGPVLATESIEIDIGQPFEQFERAIHALEHRLLVSVVAGLCARHDDETSTNLPVTEATV